MAEVFEHIGKRARRDRRRRHQAGPQGSEQGPRGDQGHPRHAAQDDRPHPDHGARRQGDLRGRGEVQESVASPCSRGCCTPRPLAPILAARRNALEVAGVQVVESERIATEVDRRHQSDREPVGRGQPRPSRTRSRRSPPRRWRWPWSGASISVSARKTRRWRRPATRLWLARRSLEENNAAQAHRQPRSRPAAVADLPRGPLAGRAAGGGPDAPRGRGTGGPAPPGGNAARHSRQRAHQGSIMTQWWDRVNGWFRGAF